MVKTRRVSIDSNAEASYKKHEQEMLSSLHGVVSDKWTIEIDGMINI